MIEAAEGLVDFPALGRQVPESEEETIRELLYQNYRLIYRMETERVVILALVHHARDLTSLRPPPWERA